ncbi:LPXTG cell wall anchor domain-containing protein [Enterococcus sp. 22-H-5-01]|uniref:LPXTG cell wall anchor domain-containing protein n=1 Tax=Enterococcus sp. 22-H-5-01 TaxID=3418555 RepID=UPI003D0190C3
MKKKMFILVIVLSLFSVFVIPNEAAVTNGNVQYYYEDSSDRSESSSSNNSSSSNGTTEKNSVDLEQKNRTPVSAKTDHSIKKTGILRYLQTNDQKNIILTLIGFLIIVIVLLQWQIVKNRRNKNEKSS